MFGDGKLRERLIAETRGLPIALPGFVDDRDYLARALASCDMYVSAMADETFGISVIEAQASGLPVVGVASGAMPARVPSGLGLLGPVDDVAAMAANVQAVWARGAGAMGAAARAHVVSRFSWERTFNQLIGEVYPAAMEHAAQRRARRLGWLGGLCLPCRRQWGKAEEKMRGCSPSRSHIVSRREGGGSPSSCLISLS
jgi:hypothetical protein